MKKPFTEKENEIMQHLISAHSLYIEIEKEHPEWTHPSAINTWVDGIHICQGVLKGRVVTRDYPEIFNSK